MQVLIVMISLFLLPTQIFAEAGGSGMGNGGGPGGGGVQVYTLKDAVDVRLVNDEVLDLEQLRDRFGQDVVKVGDKLHLSKKIPIVDFQNIRGEVRQIQKFQY